MSFFGGPSYLVSPDERLVGGALKGLRHQSSEPRTVFAWRLQKLQQQRMKALKRHTSKEAFTLSSASLRSINIQSLYTVKQQALNGVKFSWNSDSSMKLGTPLNLCRVWVQLCCWMKRKYLFGSAAHLILGPRDGVHWNGPPQ